MNRSYNKLFLLIVGISFLMTFYFSYINYNYPYIGVGTAIKDGKVIVNIVESQTWASKVGLKNGDEIIEINGDSPFKHTVTVKYGMLEQIKDFKIINSDNEVKSYQIKGNFASLQNTQNLFLLIIPYTFYFLCLFCIYFVYKTNIRLNLKSALILNVFLLIISLAYFSSTGSSRGDQISRFINLVLFLSVPVSYLHFIYQYFVELGKKLFSVKYVVFGYLLVLSNLSYEIYIELFNIEFSPARIINLISFLLLIIMVFILKINGLRKIKYAPQAYFIKIIIITNVFSFLPFIVFYLVPYLLFDRYIFPPIVLAAFLLLIPFSLVYQFVATKIYDIEFLLGRIRYYTLLAIIPTLAIVGFMLFLNTDSKSEYIPESLESTFTPIKLSAFVFLLMLLVFYFKEIVDFRFKLRRFSEKYNYQDSIFKYTNEIRKANKLNQLIDILKKIIIDVLLVNKLYFIEVNKEGKLISTDFFDKDGDVDDHLPFVSEVVTEIGKIHEVDKGFLIHIGESKGHNYILLCLSSINTPKLTRDEISWLKALSFYTNVSLENFLKIEELMNHLETVQKEGTNPSWLTKLFFSIEEKQRSNLAKDLHDSVLQDLISLKRQCEVALVELEAAPAALKGQLEDMNHNMTKIIKTTRETCQELRPQLLYDLGLVKALNKLVSQYQEIADFEIRMNAGKFQPNTDLDVQLNLYRIIQELLNNANKHSHASNVLIMLVCIKDKIVLHYEDDGIGFDQSEISYSSESMGLSGITERVKALKGTLTIETSRGEGFKAVIEI
ncbi:histidine kinase [Bacillus sp. FJAT-42376]|uniref:histidine kinase n=1 Tax=Bacillus sp. FJAT-42376 TaxID=2014076 RepID=UPI000F4F6893|nr:histidine kinase [Bacillus sp. FJAT-42376]AZB44232.1 histidine kinase [Bacillus sp. FJAT-42376]